MKPRVISFDVDGTLVKKTLADRFWFVEVPRLYIKYNHLGFDEAVEFLKRNYDEVGDRDIRWYLPKYWFDRFGFEEKPTEILKNISDEVEFFQDALDVLSSLDSDYDLIVISNAPEEFLNVQLKDVENYFSKIYSCVSDLGQVKKDARVYEKICADYGVAPEDVVHVGDDWDFDYRSPQKIGVNTFLIDRDGKFDRKNGVLRDLRDMLDIIN